METETKNTIWLNEADNEIRTDDGFIYPITETKREVLREINKEVEQRLQEDINTETEQVSLIKSVVGCRGDNRKQKLKALGDLMLLLFGKGSLITQNYLSWLVAHTPTNERQRRNLKKELINNLLKEGKIKPIKTKKVYYGFVNSPLLSRDFGSWALLKNKSKCLALNSFSVKRKAYNYKVVNYLIC